MRRRLALLLVTSLASFVLFPPTASFAAGKPTIERFRDVGTDVDFDFCGTGVAIDVAFDVRETVWVAADGSLIKAIIHGRVGFSNPGTGDAAILFFTNQVTEQITEENGLTTIALTFKGLPEKLKTANGPLLLRDAGYITFELVLDEEGNEIDFRVSVNRGPHPEADSDFTLFCEVLVPALGIA